MALPALRYTKLALLVFGGGLLLGLVVVSVGVPRLARLASIAMTLGIAALPLALVADWRRGSAPRPAAKPAARGRRKKPAGRPKPAAKPRRKQRR